MTTNDNASVIYQNDVINSTSIPSIETPFMTSTKPISVDALNNAILRHISGTTTLISSHTNQKKLINQVI